MSANPPPRERAAVTVLGLAVGLLGLTTLAQGCASPGIPHQAMEDLFRRGLADARDAEAGEVVTDLPRLDLAPSSSEEDGFRFRGEGEERRLQVVAWTQKPPGREGRSVVLQEALWVTPAPRVQEICQGIHTGGGELRLRLSQLLGLPPGQGGRRFVVLWARPGDLFRPCPDPETDDSSCEPSPSSPEVPAVGGDPYRRWFAEQYERSYQLGERAWTRLGYTYDWGHPLREVGLPELVIWPGAEVTIEAVEPTRRYCQRPRSAGESKSPASKGGGG